jgi:hypothetical protein
LRHDNDNGDSGKPGAANAFVRSGADVGGLPDHVAQLTRETQAVGFENRVHGESARRQPFLELRGASGYLLGASAAAWK